MVWMLSWEFKQNCRVVVMMVVLGGLTVLCGCKGSW